MEGRRLGPDGAHRQGRRAAGSAEPRSRGAVAADKGDSPLPAEADDGRPPGRAPGEVSQLRRRIEQLDAEILAAAAERTRVARVIGRRKSNTRQPVQDARQEALVLAAARERARDLGLSPETAEGIVRLLIEDAVATQLEEQGVAGEG
jgi:chorismate mutase